MGWAVASRFGVAEPDTAHGDRAARGRRGEDLAERLLAARGYRILERGFRTRGGEIDIIARDGDTLVFVEVKTRRSLGCGTPAEAVDRRKRARISRTAAAYLARLGRADTTCRFDVVEVFLDRPAGGATARIVRDAFQC